MESGPSGRTRIIGCGLGRMKSTARLSPLGGTDKLSTEGEEAPFPRSVQAAAVADPRLVSRRAKLPDRGSADQVGLKVSPAARPREPEPSRSQSRLSPGAQALDRVH